MERWKEVVSPIPEMEADKQFLTWLEQARDRGEVIDDSRIYKDYIYAADGGTLVRYRILISPNDARLEPPE